MKRSNWIYILGCLLIFGLFALGSGSANDSSVQKASSVKSDESGATSEESTKESSNSNQATIDEQVLYDDNDIKITATSLEDSLFGTDLKVLIENNSSQNITVQARNANINGYMVSTMMSDDVASGKKANGELTFETSGLKDCGIEQIGTIEFIFHIFDSDSWDEIVDSDVITVKTSLADTFEQNYDDSGDVLVDSHDVRIIAKGLSKADSFWGPGVILYIENNSDKDVTIQVRDVSVNGFMVESSMSSDVIAGKKAISDVQFFSSDLEKNGIEDINDVEFYFHIFDMNSLDEIYDSEVINMSF